VICFWVVFLYPTIGVQQDQPSGLIFIYQHAANLIYHSVNGFAVGGSIDLFG
jgi:hypothetical protein